MVVQTQTHETMGEDKKQPNIWATYTVKLWFLRAPKNYLNASKTIYPTPKSKNPNKEFNQTKLKYMGCQHLNI